jgi:hypothetical protein
MSIIFCDESLVKLSRAVAVVAVAVVIAAALRVALPVALATKGSSGVKFVLVVLAVDGDVVLAIEIVVAVVLSSTELLRLVWSFDEGAEESGTTPRALLYSLSFALSIGNIVLGWWATFCRFVGETKGGKDIDVFETGIGIAAAAVPPLLAAVWTARFLLEKPAAEIGTEIDTMARSEAAASRTALSSEQVAVEAAHGLAVLAAEEPPVSWPNVSNIVSFCKQVARGR